MQTARRSFPARRVLRMLQGTVYNPCRPHGSIMQSVLTNLARHGALARAVFGLCGGLVLAGSAATVPTAPGHPARTLDAQYGAAAARHIYQSFRLLVHPGELPATSLQAVTTLETTIDADGMVQDVTLIGAASDRPQITPWIIMLVQASQPFPKVPQGQVVVYRDTWRIATDGRFQLDAAGEGAGRMAAQR
jgi:hypothetical protein